MNNGFVSTGNGRLFNLDKISSLVPVTDKKGVYDVHWDDGEISKTVTIYCQPEFLSRVIPASEITFATVIYVDGKEDGSEFITSELIIGWRDLETYCHPIFRQEIASNGVAFIKTPEDRYLELDYDATLCNSLDEAIAFAKSKKANE